MENLKEQVQTLANKEVAGFKLWVVVLALGAAYLAAKKFGLIGKKKFRF